MDYLTPLESVFPGVAAAVLGVLAHTSDPLTVRQIAERAHVSHPQVSLHVDRLESLGVVRRRIAGRSHQITLTDSAVAALLRRFVGLRDDVLHHMRATARDLDPAPASIVVYGSFARGTARADSDIDVAVIAVPGVIADESFQTQLARWVDRSAVYAGNPVAEILLSTEDLRGRMEEPMWDAIRRDGVVLLGHAPHDLLHADTRGEDHR